MDYHVLRRAERIVVCIDIVLMLAMALSIFLVVGPLGWLLDYAEEILAVLFFAVGLLSAVAVFLQGLRISIGRGDSRLGKLHLVALCIYVIFAVAIGACLPSGIVNFADVILSVGLFMCIMGYFYAGIMALVNSYRQVEGSEG